MSVQVLERPTLALQRLALQTGLAAFIFIYDKSLISAGYVTAARIDIWLLGLVPVALLAAFAVWACRVDPNNYAADPTPVAKFFLSIWIVSLSLFLVATALYLTDELKLMLYRLLDFKHPEIAHSILSFGFVSFGALIWTSIVGFRQIESLQVKLRPTALLIGFALNWMIFFALLFAWPARPLF